MKKLLATIILLFACFTNISTNQVIISGVQQQSGGSIFTQTYTGLSNAVFTNTATISVPNALVSAILRVDILGIKGAGGAIGAGESVASALFDISVTRLPGIGTGKAASPTTNSATATVPGGNSGNLNVQTGSVIGSASGTQTFTIRVSYDNSGFDSSNNHSVILRILLINLNNPGVTITM